jgi:adenylate cyclase
MSERPPSRRRGQVFGVLTAFAVGVVVCAAMSLGWLKAFELSSVDARFALRGEQALDKRLVVIDIDDATLRNFGFPVPRLIFAMLVERAAERGAKAVGFDIFLVEPGDEEGADALRSAVEKHPIALFPTEYFTEDTGEGAKVTRGADPFQGIGDPTHRSHVSLRNTDDGVFRGLPLTIPDGERPAWALAARTVAKGIGAELRESPLGVEGLPPIPLDARGDALINFRAISSENVQSLPLRDFLAIDMRAKAGQALDDDPDLDALFKDAIVFVGQSAGTIGDHGPTPLARQTPLLLTHVNVADNLLTGGFLRPTPTWLAWLVTLLLAGIVGVLVVFARRASVAFAGAVLAVAVWGTLAAWAFEGGLWLPVVGPSVAALLAATAVSFVNHAVRDEHERVVRQAFDRFVAPHILDRILEAPENLDVSGHSRTLTILFSDIKGYTALSNALPADEILSMLSGYLDPMVQAIHDEEGTVDKIMGDGIMAFFGDPLPQEDHALRAVRCAIAMQRKADEMADAWGAEGRAPLRVRIGLATGEVYVGNIGGQEHLEYTCIGRPVNLASRLEGKAPPGSILISRETEEHVKDDVVLEAFGGLDLKGYSAAYNAYLVKGIKGEVQLHGFEEQRESARFQLLTDVRYSIEGVSFEARSSNFSPGGMFIVSEQLPPEGAGLTVQATLDPGFSDVVMRGVVSHVRRGKAGASGFGVMFTAIESEERETVRYLLARVLGDRADDEDIEELEGGGYGAHLGA